MAKELQDEVVRYLCRTGDCWWTARRIGTVLPHAAQEIESMLEACWSGGLLRRKRGVGGTYEYQARSPEVC